MSVYPRKRTFSSAQLKADSCAAEILRCCLQRLLGNLHTQADARLARRKIRRPGSGPPLQRDNRRRHSDVDQARINREILTANLLQYGCVAGVDRGTSIGKLRHAM